MLKKNIKLENDEKKRRAEKKRILREKKKLIEKRRIERARKESKKVREKCGCSLLFNRPNKKAFYSYIENNININDDWDIYLDTKRLSPLNKFFNNESETKSISLILTGI